MAIQQPQHHQQCQQRHQKCQSILCNSGPNIGLRWMSEEIEFGIIRSYMRMSAMCIALASVACICDHLLKSIEVSLGQFSRSSTTTHEFCNHSASRQMYARQVCAQIGPIKTKPKKKPRADQRTNEEKNAEQPHFIAEMKNIHRKSYFSRFHNEKKICFYYPAVDPSFSSNTRIRWWTEWSVVSIKITTTSFKRRSNNLEWGIEMLQGTEDIVVENAFYAFFFDSMPIEHGTRISDAVSWALCFWRSHTTFGFYVVGCTLKGAKTKTETITRKFDYKWRCTAPDTVEIVNELYGTHTNSWLCYLRRQNIRKSLNQLHMWYANSCPYAVTSTCSWRYSRSFIEWYLAAIYVISIISTVTSMMRLHNKT